METIDAVRKRPGMYVGDTDDGSGLVHLVLEVIANAYDHYLVGRCSSIAIELAADGTITVDDDGPGMAVDERLLTTRTERATADGHRPHVHLGIGGLGLFVVSALSERFEVRTVHDGIETTATCVRGRLRAPIAHVPTTHANGTTVRFRPDPELFAHVRVPRAALTAQLEDLAFLSPGLALRWSVAGDDTAAGGLAARVAIGVPCPIAQVARHRETFGLASGPIDVEVALAWRTERWRADAEPMIDSFVNLGRTEGGGEHVVGLLAGVHRFLDLRPREAALRGLVAAVSIVCADVLFGSPTKDKLVSPEARAPVTDATIAALTAWARANPDAAAALRARGD